MAIVSPMTISAKILERLRRNLDTFDEGLEAFLKALPLSQEWIQREWLLSDANSARTLLVGAKVSLLEAGTAWAIGSNRGAASSLRSYIENVFAWLYYKDHPVEFRAVVDRKIDMMLPKAVQTYTKTVDPGFDKASAIISRKRERPSEYFYTDVSQFVHAHPGFASHSTTIDEMAVSLPRDNSFITLSKMADEFISDNYLVFYRASWGDVPGLVQENASARLEGQLKNFVDAV
jgi:hypothetical protein